MATAKKTNNKTAKPKKMIHYNKVNLHLSDLQLKKIQDAVKNNNGKNNKIE